MQVKMTRTVYTIRPDGHYVEHPIGAVVDLPEGVAALWNSYGVSESQEGIASPDSGRGRRSPAKQSDGRDAPEHGRVTEDEA